MRILMVNLPFSGHTNPTLPLAKALIAAGHAVTCVNAEEMRARIEAAGADFVPYRVQDAKKQAFRACWDAAMALKGKFDLLIYEMFFYPGFTLAQKLGVPCVRLWSQPAWSVEGWLSRPFRFRLAVHLLDQDIMSAGDRQHMAQTERSLSGANLNDRPILDIVLLPEEMQDHREDFPPEQWLFQPPPAESADDDAFLPWQALRRPVVYASLGSIMSDRGFCRQVIRGFGGRDMTVILSTGKVDPESLGKLPANVHAFSHVPQLQVLRHADVFLTHCGMTSVNEALTNGVPMVMMPVMSDQPGNADRLQELGLGRRVRAIPMSGRRMAEAALAIWQDEAMKARARAMQQSVLRQQDLLLAVERIEKAAAHAAMNAGEN